MLLAPIFLAAATDVSPKTAEVRGRVLGPDGAPAAGVAVSARETLPDAEAALRRDERREPAEVGRVDTAADGRFRISIPIADGRTTAIPVP